MLTSIHIQGFKGFKDTKIDGLRRVNLILGGQNSGKTSLLEAITYVHGGDIQRELIGMRAQLPSLFRVCENNDAARYWSELLGTASEPKKLNVLSVCQGASYSMQGLVQDANSQGRLVGSIPLAVSNVGIFYGGVKASKDFEPLCISTLPYPQKDKVSLYGKIVHGKKKKKLISLLKEIESKLESIDAIAPDGEHRVYIELEGQGVYSLPMIGQGFSRLFDIYSKLLVSNSKLALIDELENGIHYSALPTVWKGIANIARELDIQLFITTHSYECIQAAAKIFENTPSEFQLIRLVRTENNVDAVCLHGENLKFALENDWELR
jgi:AAA domain, putative AbiEii toxin, Type IV TA system/AAA domain